jgi:molybdopterin synthase catalytic subunit
VREYAAAQAGTPDQVRLADIREVPLSVEEVLQAVSGAAVGGVTLFVGTVRDHDAARTVTALEYSAHPTALARLRDVLGEVAGRHPGVVLAAVHRVGRLEIGEAAVVVAAAAGHRGAAFDASRELIDDLKATVPIWKHQLFADGTEEWVGTP